MSQMDYVHFFPSFFWVVILFFVFYFFIVTNYVPLFYKMLSVRKLYLFFLNLNLKKEFFLEGFLKNYFLKSLFYKSNYFMSNLYYFFMKKYKMITICI